MPRRRTPPDPFRWFDSSPEVIRYVVMLYVRYPLSLRNVEGPAARARHRHLPRDGAALVGCASGPCSPPRSAASGFRPCVSTRTGDGISTRCT